MSSISEQDYEAFYLSMWSNLLSADAAKGTKVELEQKLYNEITGKMKLERPHWGKGWEIVWGPAVLDIDKVPANVIYVARQGSNSRYVVAIAGTNPNSIFDYLVEDALVGLQVPWSLVCPEVPNDPEIALGTALALLFLLLLMPGGTVPGASKSLLDFFRKDLPKDQKIDLCFAGHSLGGTLAPTLALLFLEWQIIWDPLKKVTISTRPTAGPTAGNEAFKSYSDQKLTNIIRYWNNLDPVPRLWNPGDMEQIKTLYKPYIPPNLITNWVVDELKKFAAPGHYYQIDPQAKSFPSKINKDYKKFFAQVDYQHLQAYLEYFDYHDEVPQLKYGTMMENNIATAYPGTSQLPPRMDNAQPGPEKKVTIQIGNKRFDLPADLKNVDMNLLRERLREEFKEINQSF